MNLRHGVTSKTSATITLKFGSYITITVLPSLLFGHPLLLRVSARMSLLAGRGCWSVYVSYFFCFLSFLPGHFVIVNSVLLPITLPTITRAKMFSITITEECQKLLLLFPQV